MIYLIYIYLQNDEPAAQKNLQHFDHNFKGELHTTFGSFLTGIFGTCKFAKRPIQVICKGSIMSIIEEIGITSKTKGDINYAQVN